jgi:protein ERP2
MFLCRRRQSRRKDWRAYPLPIHRPYPPNTCLLPQFYFAVQSGGSFDVDFEIKDPNDKVILDGQRERQGDYVLTANTVGEYSFCFENDMSTLTDKLVDIDIMVESEPRREAPAMVGQIQDQTSALEESIYRLNSLFMSIKRTQK